MLAGAVAKEFGLNFISIKVSYSFIRQVYIIYVCVDIWY